MKKASTCSLLVSLFLFVCVLFHGQPAYSQSITTWTGNAGISLKITLTDASTPPNIKLMSASMPLSGTVSFFMDDFGPVKSENCYIEVYGDNETLMCIDEITVVSSRAENSKSEKIYLVGTGTYSTVMLGIPIAGIVYMDAKGTMKKSGAGGEIVSLSLSGKIGGGGYSPDQMGFAFTGSFKGAMKK